MQKTKDEIKKNRPKAKQALPRNSGQLEENDSRNATLLTSASILGSLGLGKH